MPGSQRDRQRLCTTVPRIDPAQYRGGGGGRLFPVLPERAVVRRHHAVREQADREELMSAAEQAFLFTGELFVFAFLAIAAFWFADKLRRNLTGKS
jgi:hypothetical protein